MPAAPSRWRCAYGIDAGPERPVLVRAARSGRKIVFTTEVASAGTLQRVAEEVARGKATVAASMPVTETFVRKLSAPLPGVSKAMRVFPSLLDLQIPAPVEKCSCVIVGARPIGGNVEALAVAARKEDVLQRIGAVAGMGAEPLLLDHEGVAIWEQSLLETPLGRDGCRMTIYLGHDRTAMVLGTADRLLSAHGSRHGWGASGSPASAVAQRAKQMVLAELGSEGMAALQWTFAGPCASPEILEALKKALALTDESSYALHRDPALFLARAVARRAVQPGAMPVNFLQDDLEPAGVRGMREAASNRLLVTTMAAGIALALVSAGWLFALDFRKESLQAEITRAAERISGLPRVPRGQEVLTVQRALDERSPAVKPMRDALTRPWLTLLAPLLDSAARLQATLETLSAGPLEFTLSGSAPAGADLTPLADAARKDRWQADLKSEESDGRLRFVLKGFR